MCFILATYYLTEEHVNLLLREWNSNPHGAGIAYIERIKPAKGGRSKTNLKVEKGLMTKTMFNKSIKNQLGNTVVAHLRFATHGEMDEINTHPFMTCRGNAALFHNGIMPAPWSSSGDVSDSRMFANTLNLLTFIDVMKDSRNIGDQIGWNKVVFLSKTGYIHIINEQYGEWMDKGNFWVSQRISKYRSLPSKDAWKASKYDVGEYTDLDSPGWVKDKDGVWVRRLLDESVIDPNTETTEEEAGWESEGRKHTEKMHSLSDEEHTSRWLDAEARTEISRNRPTKRVNVDDHEEIEAAITEHEEHQIPMS